MKEYVDLLKTEPSIHVRFLDHFTGNSRFRGDWVDYLCEDDIALRFAFVDFYEKLAPLGAQSRASTMLDLALLDMRGQYFFNTYVGICEKDPDKMVTLMRAAQLFCFNKEIAEEYLVMLRERHGGFELDFGFLRQQLDKLSKGDQAGQNNPSRPSEQLFEYFLIPKYSFH